MKQVKVSKKKTLVAEALERENKTISNKQGEICIFVNNPKHVYLEKYRMLMTWVK